MYRAGDIEARLRAEEAHPTPTRVVLRAAARDLSSLRALVLRYSTRASAVTPRGHRVGVQTRVNT